ncbi:hypothetical protein HUJ04_000192 [Dendroctonus ponderosae]|nr:hypothetical protein HUJ04_005312 [Dendroctonus ponderosae]KAH1000273.1 hypothetical protein HUJ04_000192 [Dendroctonus ponderosae]
MVARMPSSKSTCCRVREALSRGLPSLFWGPRFGLKGHDWRAVGRLGTFQRQVIGGPMGDSDLTCKKRRGCIPERLSAVTHKIREFINREVIGDRFERHQPDMEPADYLDSLIGRVKAPGKEPLDWDTALFALEDIIGGHAAVGNFLTKLFAFLVAEPQVQRRIQQEIDAQVGVDQPVTISHRLVYTQAVIYEAIRLISSPIVPRVANQTSELGGYTIEKGTVLFLNNHDLSMSEELWAEPQQFRPERFIRAGKLFKPEYFLPFGGGRRSCMGYKLVQLVSLGVVGAIMQRFTLRPLGGDLAPYRVPIGSLALPKDSFTFQLEKR